MMEHWNIGFKGMKPIETDDFLLFVPTIPPFHYSTIPSFQIYSADNCRKRIYDYNVL
jgi:hypothetical protein